EAAARGALRGRDLACWCPPDAPTRLAPAVPLYSPPLSDDTAAMPHSPEEKRKVLARIRRIRGQCEGLERALEAGADCGPAPQQIAAIRRAVNRPTSAVLAPPLRQH